MSELQSWLDNNGGATASELCGGVVTWTNDYAGGAIPTVSCDNDTTGRLSVTFIASDECANSVQVTARFIMVDTLAPSILAPALDTVVNCDGLGNLTELQLWLDNNGGASASELCGGSVSWTNDYAGGGVPSITCDNDTTNRVTVTFTASDDCANTIQQVARFIIIDTIAPTITANAQDTVVFCDGTDMLPTLQSWIDNNGGAVATESCGGTVTWTHDYLGGGIPPVPCDSDTTNRLTITFTASDDCANTIQQVARFIVVDLSLIHI